MEYVVVRGVIKSGHGVASKKRQTGRYPEGR